jgi:two-component system response regulator NreC
VFSSQQRKLSASLCSLLSPREISVLVLIASFNTDYDIAEKLDISDSTVEKHRFNIQRKLHISGRSNLLKYAQDHGFMHG